jgi:NDP-4-keto-2,6-dideoxyhexose 3-C-methyltransferase
MMKRNAFDAIVHEHLCYYDVPTLARMYAKHGLVIEKVTSNEVNGGSVRVFARKRGSVAARDASLEYPEVSALETQSFAARVMRWRTQMREILDSDLMRYRPLWGYGASTKLRVLLGYLGRNEAFIGIADRNAAKWGKRMGGTGISIVNEVEFRAAKPGYVLVGPWAFRDEFIERERQLMNEGATLIFPLPTIEFVF